MLATVGQYSNALARFSGLAVTCITQASLNPQAINMVCVNKVLIRNYVVKKTVTSSTLAMPIGWRSCESTVTAIKLINNDLKLLMLLYLRPFNGIGLLSSLRAGITGGAVASKRHRHCTVANLARAEGRILSRSTHNH